MKTRRRASANASGGPEAATHLAPQAPPTIGPSQPVLDSPRVRGAARSHKGATPRERGGGLGGGGTGRLRQQAEASSARGTCDAPSMSSSGGATCVSWARASAPRPPGALSVTHPVSTWEGCGARCHRMADLACVPKRQHRARPPRPERPRRSGLCREPLRAA